MKIFMPLVLSVLCSLTLVNEVIAFETVKTYREDYRDGSGYSNWHELKCNDGKKALFRIVSENTKAGHLYVIQDKNGKWSLYCTDGSWKYGNSPDAQTTVYEPGMTSGVASRMACYEQ